MGAEAVNRTYIKELTSQTKSIALGRNGEMFIFPVCAHLSCHKLALNLFPILHMTEVAHAAGSKELLQTPILQTFNIKYLNQRARMNKN